MTTVRKAYDENAGKFEAVYRGYTLGYFSDDKQAMLAIQTAESEFICYGTLLGKKI